MKLTIYVAFGARSEANNTPRKPIKFQSIVLEKTLLVWAKKN